MTIYWDRHALPLLGAILVAALPYLFRVPFWLSIAVFIFCAGAVVAIRNHWPLPPRALKWLLVISGVAAVNTTFGHIVGQEPGTSLFLMMSFLKLLEVKTDRDRMVSLCMAYFLLAANLFFHQDLIMAAHMLLSVWVTTTVMIHIHERRPRWPAHLKSSGAMVFQALPIMVLLFFLFPRIQGSLWGMSSDAGGTTGFSTRLSLGDVSKIVKNNAVAFRVTFEQSPPPAENRYWRGIVFWDFDGTAWERGRALPPRDKLIGTGEPTTYTITMEPTGQRWLFALDMPWEAAQGTWMDAGYTLRAAAPVGQRFSYRLMSYSRYRTPPAPPWEMRRGTQVPEGNPRTDALGRRWAAEFADTTGIVSAAISFFTHGNFTYTLNPPLPEADPVDQFLFETKRGYCEHFATAFALLMRAAGVPARVVGGYLGGESNPYGNYLIIRQSDAHAWVEYLDDEDSWVRIDPTALVAPDRVSRSLTDTLPPDELPAYLAVEGFGWAGKRLRTLRLSWDAANLIWQRWVASYSRQHQARLLSLAGISMKSWKGAALSGAAAIMLTALIVGIIALGPRLRFSHGEDRGVKSYSAFIKKVVKAGLPAKSAHEGPLAYSRRIARCRPDLAEDVAAITSDYTRWRYGRSPSPAVLAHLRRRVHRFQPQKRHWNSPPQKRPTER